MAQRLNNAPAAGYYAAPEDVPRVHVHTAKAHPKGSDLLVHSDLVAQAMPALPHLTWSRATNGPISNSPLTSEFL